MAASKIAIANMALAKIGARAITSLTEDSQEARAINRIYDDVLDEVLSESLWSFAQKRVALATVDEDIAMDDDGMDVVYAKPSDFIKLNFISDENAVVKVEGNRILSDTADLKIIYTYRNVDPTTYFAKFTGALVSRLASEIAFPITKSRAVATDLRKLYEDVDLPSAKSGDSQQGTPISPRSDEWLNQFLHNSSGVASTGATWHMF